MAERPSPILERVLDLLLQQGDHDADAIATRLMGGDFTVDAVPVAKEDEQAMRREQWVTDPQSAQQWRESVLPEEFINEAIDAMAPDFSKEARKFFFEAIEAGIQPIQAMGMANQYDRTIKMQQNPQAYAVPQNPMDPMMAAPTMGMPPSQPMTLQQPMPAPPMGGGQPMSAPMPMPQPMPGGMM